MIDYKQRMSDHCRVEDYILHKTNYYLWRNPYVSYRYIGKYAVFFCLLGKIVITCIITGCYVPIEIMY